MKIIALNGSARKNWNTSIMLNNALEGAKSQGAETELINVYDLNYKGCIGCLGCKVKGSKNLGHCVVNDDLKPLFEKIENSDGLILGSPIYMGDVTGMLRIFLERFFFQHLNYDDYSKPLYTSDLKTAFIYTMNADSSYYNDLFKRYDNMANAYFNNIGTLSTSKTLQVNDYSKYHLASFNEEERKKRREEVFPVDCQKAFDLGKLMATK